MVTLAPVGAEPGVTPVITGITRNDAVLLAAPPTVTTTSMKPGRRLLGTGDMILVSVQEVGTDATPPMVTVLAPCVVPKPEPLIVRAEPTGLTGPAVGEIVEMAGAAKAKEPNKRPRINRTALRNRRFLAMVVSYLEHVDYLLFYIFGTIVSCRLTQSIDKTIDLQELFGSSVNNYFSHLCFYQNG